MDDRTTSDSDKPTPDPTVLTTSQLLRVVASERDYTDGQIAVVRERLNGMDRANEVLNETIHRVPTDLQKGMEEIRTLMDERSEAVAERFAALAILSSRESDLNQLALAAAFAAQKEAAGEQNKANTEKINKSELATTETINKNAQLALSTTNALGDKVDDLKDRVNRVEAARAGMQEQRTEQRAVSTSMIAMIGLVVLIVSTLSSVLIAMLLR